MIVKIFLSLLIGYVAGLFLTAFLIGKIVHKDLRKYGSGNLGTTNVIRVLGKPIGVINYIMDAVKAVAAVLIVHALFQSDLENLLMYEMYAMIGVMLGHCYPIYLKFRGGKGIASMSGAMLAISFPVGLIGIAAFFVFMYVTRYVSVGSLVMSGVYMALISFMTASGRMIAGPAATLNIIALSVFMFVLTVWTHRANIGRLIRGHENRIGSKKKTE